MIVIRADEVVDSIVPDSVERLGELIGLLEGHDVRTNLLTEHNRSIIQEFLDRVLADPEVSLSAPELNELLLLFDQNRLGEPFFNFFFLGEADATDSGEASVLFRELKAGIKKFRAFSMLSYGNFRFAFRDLSEEPDPRLFIERLKPWNLDSDQLRSLLSLRSDSLTPLAGGPDEVPGDETWLLGYLSSGQINSDKAAIRELIKEASEGRDPYTTAFLRKASDDLQALSDRQLVCQEMGKRNTVRYLTSDYLDVYVATSMRQRWEFEETNSFVSDVFLNELNDLSQLRWFDPTQAYSDLTIDKGLVEGLMLKRALCTIYMAQEGDTLGKDSELAATLAQGKPVIAFVRSIRRDSLKAFAEEILNRPIRYFRQRLLTLQADGFFDRTDNREAVCSLAEEVGLSIQPDELRPIVQDFMELIRDFEISRTFQLVGDEERNFREKESEALKQGSLLVAAIESKAFDNRAETIKSRHPLSFQVHLETGVANGVLVARTAKQCADLVRGIFLLNLSFEIATIPNPDGDAVATVLQESETQSRFRVVTDDECLTNSFWNFYFEDAGSIKGGEHARKSS